jgi:RNA recognition motif-containing protein
VTTAGRKGTKRFVDPCKVWIGNLPYSASENHVKDFLKAHLGHLTNLHSLKLIRDWKTGESKGYAFAVFTDPMFATCAMEYCSGKELMGRRVEVNQGKKKLSEADLYIKKSKKKPVDQEEAAIQEGLDLAEDDSDEDAEPDEDETVDLSDFDESDDALLFEDISDDDDDEYDGVFEDLYPSVDFELSPEEELRNRQQRREVQRRIKRKKLPHKGFDPNWKEETTDQDLV